MLTACARDWGPLGQCPTVTRPQNLEPAYVQGGATLSHTSADLRVSQHYMTDKATSGYSPRNGQVTREGTLHP